MSHPSFLLAVAMLAAFVHYGHGGQAALRAAPDMTAKQWFRKCSTPDTSWLRSYIRWAKGQRSKGIPAAGVKYLVWSCEVPPGRNSATKEHLQWSQRQGTPGLVHLALQLRGIMLALRIAATTNRLLLVQQSKPAPMEVFLAPHLINWSVDPSQLPAFEDRKLYTSLLHYCERGKSLGVRHHWNRTVSCAFFSLMVSCASGAHVPVLPDLHTVPGASSSSVGMHILPVPLLAKQAKGTVQRMEEQFVFLETSSPPWNHYAGVSHPIRSPRAQHCTFTALFQASEGTQQAAARHLALLGVQPGLTPYAVLHLRLGGSAGEGVTNYHHKGSVAPAGLGRRPQVVPASSFTSSCALPLADSAGSYPKVTASTPVWQSHSSHALPHDTCARPGTLMDTTSCWTLPRRCMLHRTQAGGAYGAARSCRHVKHSPGLPTGMAVQVAMACQPCCLLSRRQVSVEEVLAAVQCVKKVITPKIRSTVEAKLKLQKETSFSNQALVLVTDNTELRQLVSQQRLLPQLAAVPSTPVHWDRFRDENLTAVFEVMADLVVMARATCLVHSRGGFSHTASMWSGSSCYRDLKECS
ncbi:hypothetical protein QJQ45_019756 [Haematococcus lacustris]|nr:hypothetical protein QJQ45_019756 [Haematococcus lacustris]